jgi:hypothetical protein
MKTNYIPKYEKRASKSPKKEESIYFHDNKIKSEYQFKKWPNS